MKQRLVLVLLNTVFYGMFVINTLGLIPILALVVTLQAPFIRHRAAMRQFRQLIRVYGKAVIGSAYPWVKVRVEGREHLPAEPVIYIFNHRSASDPFLVAFVPGEIIQIVNSWPMRLPILGFFANAAGYLGVNDMPVEEFFIRARRHLDQGVNIAGFPEGTRATTLEVGPFHSSLFRLAQESSTPIVPVCMSGNERIPHKGSRILHPGLIRIRILPPWRPADMANMTAFQLKQAVRNQIQESLRTMDGTTS